MQARRADLGVRRKFLVAFDVARQRGARVHALEQVVAQHAVLGDAAAHRAIEHRHVVQALAGIDAFAEHVLVDVRDRAGVRVHAAAAADDVAIQRALAAPRQQRHDARLHDAVAGDDAAARRVEHRPVQRVRGRADHLRCRVQRQPRVGVERDDVAHVARVVEPAVGAGEERPGLAAQQQRVQLLELAALALPAHPAALACIPETAAVQQVEARSGAARGPIGGIQVLDAVARSCEQRGIVRRLLGGRIGPIAEQREADHRIAVGRSMHLELLDQMPHLRDGVQQHRRREQRAAVLGQPLLQAEPRQAARREHGHEQPVDQRERELRGRPERRDRERHARGDRRWRAVERADPCQRGRDDHERQAGDQQHVAAAGVRQQRAQQPLPQRRRDAEALLESDAAAVDQPVADVALAGRHLLRAIGGARGAAQRERRRGDVRLGAAAAHRELLDGVAIAVARAVVGALVARLVEQQRLDRRGVAEELAPVGGGDVAERSDEVARGDVVRALAGVLAGDQVVDAELVRREHGAESAERRHGLAAGEAQALQELQPPGTERQAGRWRQLGSGRVRGRRVEDAVRQRVGLLARSQRAAGARGDPREVHQQREPQHRRQGPELAHQQRPRGVAALHEGFEAHRVETAVRMGDIGRHQRVDPRLGAAAGRRRHVRQAVQLAPRQRIGQVGELLLDDVDVLDQPACGRGDGPTARDRLLDHAAGVADGRSGVPQQREDVEAAATRGRGIGLLRRELACKFLQPLVAEKRSSGRFVHAHPGSFA